MRRAGAALVISLVLLALAGCGAGTDRAQQMALAALQLKPPTPPSSPTSTQVPPCGDPTASLRPPAVMPAAGAMPAGSYMAKIQRRGYLIAGVDQNTLLFAYFNPLDNQLEGFEIDLLHQLARAILGNPNAIHYRAVTTAERVSAVQDGSVDIVADAMTMTCQRRTQVDFSSVYYDAKQRLLVPLNSPIHGVADLAGRRVCATVGSTSIQTLASLPSHPISYPVAQRTDCLVALQEGRVDAVTSDDSILLGFRAQDPYTKLVGPPLADEPYGMAISKAHPDFVRFVNGVLARLRGNGDWRAMFSQRLGSFAATPAPPAPHYSG
jgi:polar amino acid transport system substrate-binding protein